MHKIFVMASPRHAEEGDAAVVGLGLADDAVVLLVDVAVGRLNARMLVRPVGLVVGGQAQREVEVVGGAGHDGAAVAAVRDVHHLRASMEGGEMCVMTVTYVQEVGGARHDGAAVAAVHDVHHLRASMESDEVRVMTMTYAQVVGGAGHDGAAVAQCTMYITCATA